MLNQTGNYAIYKGDKNVIYLAGNLLETLFCERQLGAGSRDLFLF